MATSCLVSLEFIIESKLSNALVVAKKSAFVLPLKLYPEAIPVYITDSDE
jgi:hypothetical protein